MLRGDGQVGARHCLLGGLGPTDPIQPRATQASQPFENLATAPGPAGFTLADMARTWFFNDDILAWYGDFNRVRTAHYARTLSHADSLPASTGEPNFKCRTDTILFAKWLQAYELQTMPHVPAPCDICRDDMWFELELDAGRTDE